MENEDELRSEYDLHDLRVRKLGSRRKIFRGNFRKGGKSMSKVNDDAISNRDMKEEYDFSQSVKNPYIKKLKK